MLEHFSWVLDTLHIVPLQTDGALTVQLGQLVVMQCVNGIDAVYELFLPMSRIEDNEFSRLAKEEAKVRKMDPCEALKIIRKSIEKDLREKYHGRIPSDIKWMLDKAEKLLDCRNVGKNRRR